MAIAVPPLDPDSTKGREVAERFNQVLAEIFAELDAKSAARRVGARRRKATTSSRSERGAA